MISIAVHSKLRLAVFGEFGREIGIQVEIANKFRGISHRSCLHSLGIDEARKHIVALRAIGTGNGGINVANA